MDNICEQIDTETILNNDYDRCEHIIEFNSIHNKSCVAIDKLTTYFKNIAINECSNLYMFYDANKGNIFACIDGIYGVETQKDFEKMIKNVLSSKIRMSVKHYNLKITHPHSHLSFHYWLCYCINKNNGGRLTPYVYKPEQRNDEPDMQDIVCNLDYVNNFRDNKRSIKYDDILTDTKHTNSLFILDGLLNNNKRQKNNNMIKRFFKNCKKDIFFNNFNKHFRFTKDNNDYLSKTVVCDLLDLDYNSKKDIRYINDMLIGYGVSYDRKKMIKKECGVFISISLK